MRPTLRPNAAVAPLALMALAAVGIDTLRLGFYSDDWLLLDGARRAAFISELLGHHGIWPWFRPLSREMYFIGIVAAGPLGLLFARALSATALIVSAYALFRLAPRVLTGPGGTVAAALFLTFAFTKYLAAWASGFQDLLAMAFVLSALLAYDRGRPRIALACAFGAMFSKETGFVVVPLLAAWELLVARRNPGRNWAISLAALTAVALALHVAVRATWPTRMALPASQPAYALWSRLAEFFAGFWMPGRPPDGRALVLGLVAAGACAWLFALESRAHRDAARRSTLPGKTAGRRAGLAFVALLLGAGLAPTMIAHLGHVTPAQPWHAYPATAGACLALAAIVTLLPRVVLRPALVLLVCANVWGQAYVEPDVELLRDRARPQRGWEAQVLLDARTRRLADDLRILLADRPESLVVLFEKLPHATFLQTGDGPATREILRDPTVLTYFLGDSPRGVQPRRVRILVGDPERMRLVPYSTDPSEVQLAAITSLMRGEPRPARALFAYAHARSAWSAADAYLDAVAGGLDEGPDAMLDALKRAGMGDSTGVEADAWADSIGGTADRGVQQAFRNVLRNPRSARRHFALAETLSAREAHLPATVEFQLAGSLRPDWGAPHLRLGEIYRFHGRWAQARSSFAAAEHSAGEFEIEAEARRSLHALALDSASMAHGSDDPTR